MTPEEVMNQTHVLNYPLKLFGKFVVKGCLLGMHYANFLRGLKSCPD
jgi:hypothetical protein